MPMNTKLDVKMDMKRMIVKLSLMSGIFIPFTGCKDLTGSGDLPAGTPNPSFYNTASGAIGLRNGAMFGVQYALQQYLGESGLLTDELQDNSTGASAGVLLQHGGVLSDPLDERILPEGAFTAASWSALQAIRGKSNLAINALATYDTVAADSATQRVMRGELYAMEAYSEIMLADLFCSGVPLSTLDFQQDFTYAPSSNTTQLYQDALHKLDSALTLAVSSDSVRQLARVLQGRAYVDLGLYAVAKDDVTTVPTQFRYTLALQLKGNGGINVLNGFGTISDREGTNGLPYRSSHDPRTAFQVTCIPNSTFCPIDTLTFPVKYNAAFSGNGYTTFNVTDGIEARLIEAEADLQPANAPGGPWLATLNTLRASAIIPGRTALLPNQSDSLPDLTDPGTTTGRITLLFQERAYWLFLTGHRQGDLRRLLRQYGPLYSDFLSDQRVYPSGLYTAPGTGRYGTDVTVPIPLTEYANPDFHGCLDRNP